MQAMKENCQNTNNQMNSLLEYSKLVKIAVRTPGSAKNA